MAEQYSPSVPDLITTNTTSLSTIDISPSGDVVFVVGPEQRRMRVHSAILRAASEVFDAMLGPSYSEGADLSSATPKDIPLPEDDAEALEVLFNAVHYRTEAIDDPLDPSLVLRTAIMAHKYDFIDALKLSFRDWLRCDVGHKHDAKALWQLAIASCWLDNERGFKDSTEELGYSYGGSYVELGEVDMMPPGVAGSLAAQMEEQRGKIRMSLVSRLFDIGVKAPTHICSIRACTEVRGMNYLKHMFGGLWPDWSGDIHWSGDVWKGGNLNIALMPRMSIAEAITSIKINAHRNTTSEILCERSSTHEDLGFEKSVREVVEDFEHNFHGLFLHDFLRQTPPPG